MCYRRGYYKINTSYLLFGLFLFYKGLVSTLLTVWPKQGPCLSIISITCEVYSRLYHSYGQIIRPIFIKFVWNAPYGYEEMTEWKFVISMTGLRLGLSKVCMVMLEQMLYYCWVSWHEYSLRIRAYIREEFLVYPLIKDGHCWHEWDPMSACNLDWYI